MGVVVGGLSLFGVVASQHVSSCRREAGQVRSKMGGGGGGCGCWWWVFHLSARDSTVMGVGVVVGGLALFGVVASQHVVLQLGLLKKSEYVSMTKSLVTREFLGLSV